MHNQGTWDQLLNVTQAKLGQANGADRRKLPISAISPNADQPRKFFDAQALSELADSIAVHGVLQPLLVRPHPQDRMRFQIVAGERRWLACQQAGLTEVPTVVRDMSDQEALELGLVENVLREDITPMEEARALKRLIDAFGYSYARLGERLGKNKAYVDHRVRLLKMPNEVQEALERPLADGDDGRVKRPFTPRHAGVVVQLAEEGERVALIEAIFSEGLSVAESSQRLKQVMAPEAAEPIQLAVDTVLPAATFDRETAAVAAPVESHDDSLAEEWEDFEVSLDGLALQRLFSRAQRGSGKVMASQLLAAMQADRKRLKSLGVNMASTESRGARSVRTERDRL